MFPFTKLVALKGKKRTIAKTKRTIFFVIKLHEIKKPGRWCYINMSARQQ